MIIKTHVPGKKYNKPHFYILNKGYNSGKPLKVECPNCFVACCENDSEKDKFYWICFALWKAKSFHPFLRGSVIPFMSIYDIKKLLLNADQNVKFSYNEDVPKLINSLNSINSYEVNLKKQLELATLARIMLCKKFIS